MSKNDINIYAKFFGKKEVNGIKRKYWIQRSTSEYHSEIVRHMTNGFVKDEILSKNNGLIDCKESMEEMKMMFEKLLAQNAALICFTEDSNGNPIIAGMNVTFVSRKDEPPYEPKGEKFTVIFRLLDHLSKQNDAFQKLNCNAYLYAMGLYVLPEFRGEGLGVYLLKAREPLCREIGLKHSCTVFTSVVSQSCALKAGFHDLTVLPYRQIFNEHPEWYIPNVAENTPNVRYMVIEYK